MASCSALEKSEDWGMDYGGAFTYTYFKTGQIYKPKLNQIPVFGHWGK